MSDVPKQNLKELLAARLTHFLTENRGSLTDQELSDIYFTGAMAFMVRLTPQRRAEKFKAMRTFLEIQERLERARER